MNKLSHISQVGNVTLADGSNETFDHITECWPFDGKMTALLFLDLKALRAPIGEQTYKWKVVMTADTFEAAKEHYKIASAYTFTDWQNYGRTLGEWELAEVLEWNEKCLGRIAQITHKENIMMATFK